MPAKSEIDDIFAARGKEPIKKVEKVSTDKIDQKKKKKKKTTTTAAATATEEEELVVVVDSKPAPRRKRPAPETILDPSLKRKKPKLDGKKAKKNDELDDEKFKDSRGTGPRRKTEEGYSIYKENELGIGNEGGDTPLCPFDCNCCF